MSKQVVIEEHRTSKLSSCSESISPLLSHLTDGEAEAQTGQDTQSKPHKQARG